MIKEYENYRAFVVDVLVTTMAEGHATIICNYKDYGGLIASLNDHAINGESSTLDVECAENFDDDIITAQMNDGNMMITVFKDATVIGEPILFKTSDAYIDGTYYVEADAKSTLDLPLGDKVVPFCIRGGIEI